VNAAALASLASAPSAPCGRCASRRCAWKTRRLCPGRANPEPGIAGYEIRLARDHGPLSGKAPSSSATSPAPACPMSKDDLPVLGSRRRLGRPAQPGHLPADTAQPAGAGRPGEVNNQAQGPRIPAVGHAQPRAFHPALRVFRRPGRGFRRLRLEGVLPRCLGLRSNGPTP
jgi:hypothetical protein